MLQTQNSENTESNEQADSSQTAGKPSKVVPYGQKRFSFVPVLLVMKCMCLSYKNKWFLGTPNTSVGRITFLIPKSNPFVAREGNLGKVATSGQQLMTTLET